MEYTIAPLSSGHRKDVIDIFNYYIENSFAAYPEKKVPYQLLDMFVQLSDGFPAGMIKDDDDTVVGFGMLRAHNPMPTFSNTAEVTYFIDPRHTGKGLGQMLLTFLESGAIERGIEIILASISSLITGSIRFHLKSGFTECGRFRRIGMKNG